jgi:hypothetical protein
MDSRTPFLPGLRIQRCFGPQPVAMLSTPRETAATARGREMGVDIAAVETAVQATDRAPVDSPGLCIDYMCKAFVCGRVCVEKFVG